MKQIKLINIENVSEEEAATYRIREAARAVVFDKNKHVALLNATKNNYYKLPGGGLEKGEDHETALKRECKEEIGCDIKVVGEVGFVVEYRKQFKMKQTSFCYIAELVGDKSVNELTQDEIDEGFEVVWLPFGEALKKVRESEPVIYEGPYMVERDRALLEAVKVVI